MAQMMREAELDELRRKLEEAGRVDVGKTVKDTVDPTGSLSDDFDPAQFARELKRSVEEPTIHRAAAVDGAGQRPRTRRPIPAPALAMPEPDRTRTRSATRRGTAAAAAPRIGMALSDEEVDKASMPLLDHLVELRRRLIYCVAGLIVLFFVCYAFAPEIYGFLVQPLADILAEKGGGERRMIYTALQEAFFTYVKVAFFAAAFLGFPLIAVQLYRFVAPGLYRHERRAFVPFLVATPVLFFIGGARGLLRRLSTWLGGSSSASR